MEMSAKGFTIALHEVTKQLQLLTGRLKPCKSDPASYKHLIFKTKTCQMLHLFLFSFSSPALPFNFRYLDVQFFCLHLVFVLAWTQQIWGLRIWWLLFHCLVFTFHQWRLLSSAMQVCKENQPLLSWQSWFPPILHEEQLPLLSVAQMVN